MFLLHRWLNTGQLSLPKKRYVPLSHAPSPFHTPNCKPNGTERPQSLLSALALDTAPDSDGRPGKSYAGAAAGSRSPRGLGIPPSGASGPGPASTHASGGEGDDDTGPCKPVRTRPEPPGVP